MAETCQAIKTVAPFAGAWIEIVVIRITRLYGRSSLPSRERGLKSSVLNVVSHAVNVAPFAGAWIEISEDCHFPVFDFVAPFAGAWIEIFSMPDFTVTLAPSLPSRERGLKYGSACASNCGCGVAPFAGAWIEIRCRVHKRILT